MADSDDPGYWERVRQEALEEMNRPGATAKDREEAGAKLSEAEQQLHRMKPAPSPS